MSQTMKTLVPAALLLGCTLMAQAQNLALPSTSEATVAIVDMFSGSGLPQPSRVQLGTCIAAVDPSHPGQLACTVAVTLGAATNETQLDFFKQGKQWKAQPSASQDKLPFPDPKLH